MKHFLYNTSNAFRQIIEHGKIMRMTKKQRDIEEYRNEMASFSYDMIPAGTILMVSSDIFLYTKDIQIGQLISLTDISINRVRYAKKYTCYKVFDKEDGTKVGIFYGFHKDMKLKDKESVIKDGLYLNDIILDGNIDKSELMYMPSQNQVEKSKFSIKTVRVWEDILDKINAGNIYQAG